MSYIERYIGFLSKFIDVKSPVKGVFDCSNGPVGKELEELFAKVDGVEAVIINNDVDGEFSAHGPNPLKEGALDDIREAITSQGADFGAIFDGDADRVLFLDEKGNLVDTFVVFALIKKDFEPPYVVDVRALSGFAMQDEDVIESKAGRFFLWQTMKGKKASLGAERTGHYFFKDFWYFDSAVLATVHMINIVSSIKADGGVVSRRVSDLVQFQYPPEINFEVGDAGGSIERVKKGFLDKRYKLYELDGVTVQGEDFAFNLRASATEPVVRLNIAASDKDVLDRILAKVKELIA